MAFKEAAECGLAMFVASASGLGDIRVKFGNTELLRATCEERCTRNGWSQNSCSGSCAH